MRNFLQWEKAQLIVGVSDVQELQLQELSLLVGSIGLFVMVALLMYTSFKVHWEKLVKAQGKFVESWGR